MRVLIVEDDRALAGFIRRGLESEGNRAEVVHDASSATATLGRMNYDLMVLDLGLPGMSGLEFLKTRRAGGSDLPVLVLTGRNRVEDRVACLDAGADDCLVKPFSFVELSARVRALSRRGTVVKVEDHCLRYQDLVLNRVERTVERGGRQIELTTKEFALLEYLMRNAGMTVSRSMILKDVWRIGFDTMTNVIDVYINYLRKKVDGGATEKLICTVRGSGYRLGNNERGEEVTA